MKKILLLLFLALGTLLYSCVNSYDLNEKDYEYVDKIGDKLYNAIENNQKLQAQKVVDLIYDYIETKDLSMRNQAILETVADDLEYTYFLGRYSEDQGDYEMKEDDCFEGEYYDEEEKLCYIMEDEEDHDLDQYYNQTYSHHHTSHSDENNPHSVYSISGNTIELQKGKSQARDMEIFEIFSSVIPSGYREELVEYSVYDDSSSDTYAYVEPMKDDLTKWRLVVNLALLYKNEELDETETIKTLIHEYSHILTLKSSQVNGADNSSDIRLQRSKNMCKTYFVREGCLRQSSYLNSFISLYWKDNFQVSQEEGENDFYSGAEEDFVSEYASTNPGEDIAESFTYFILKKKPQSETLADKKVLFFYNYQELVDLRKLMRNRLNLLEKN